MEQPTKMDMYREVKKYCTCNRQITIHVSIMALTGIVYLGIGILIGYYIGKHLDTEPTCKFRL